MALEPRAPLSRCSLTVLPMLPLGAPVGVLVVRDLDPLDRVVDLYLTLARRLLPFARNTTRWPAEAANLILYHVDLSLDAFPSYATWGFLSTTPLSQVLEHAGRPSTMEKEHYRTLGACFGSALDVATPEEPPRVIHLIAEIIEDIDDRVSLPPRISPARTLLRLADPHTFAELHAFLSSPPEPLPPTSASSRAPPAPSYVPLPPCAPYYLRHVPSVAQLTLPERTLFVRPVYVKLLDDILRTLPHKKRFVYVTATAGAGKTAFLWFVLHALCRRGRGVDSHGNGPFLAPPMDIVLDVPGLFALIDTAGQVFTGPRRDCFRVELMKKETLYLVDLARSDHQELLREANYCNTDIGDYLDSIHGHASRILVGLPRHRVEARASSDAHAIAVKRLPLWRPCELELCRRRCFPALDRVLWLERIALWGCQPHWTLAVDPCEGVARRRLDKMLRHANRRERIMDAVIANYIDDDLESETPWPSGKQRRRDNATLLLRLRAPRRGDLFWRVDWCSPTVRDAVHQRL